MDIRKELKILGVTLLIVGIIVGIATLAATYPHYMIPIMFCIVAFLGIYLIVRMFMT